MTAHFFEIVRGHRPRLQLPAQLTPTEVHVSITQRRAFMKIEAIIANRFCVLFAAVSLMAHHSMRRSLIPPMRVTMKGEITKIEWTNPTPFIYVNVKDAAGKVVNYSW
jgi:hypothetical protein